MFLILIAYVQPFNYVYPGNGARGNGMKSFYTLSDPTSVWWNPGTPSSGTLAVYGDWNNLLGMFTLITGSATINVKNMNFSTGFSYFTSGAMPINPEIEDSSVLPESTGVFSVNEKAFVFGVNRRLRNKIHGGIALKILQQDIVGIQGVGFGVDIGLLYSGMLNIGIVIKDIGNTSIHWSGTTTDIIRTTYTIAVGSGFERGDWKIYVESSVSYQSSLFYAAGIELKFREIVQIRGGWSNKKGPGAGMGLKFGNFSLNYTISPNEFGYINRIGFSYIKGR